MADQDCKQCEPPKPALFRVRAQGAPHSDIALTCSEHLAATVQAYARQGYKSLVSVINLEGESSE